jgi:putative radical SAM enzyme (TIGR03279 family)
MRRIVEQRLSPQYVSIHATDLAVRAYLLGVDEHRADIATRLARLLDAGIEIHAQVVLCPGINDGEILRRTINDLAAEYPRITSVAIVPLGLTRYNTDPRLTAVTPDFCRQTIVEVTAIQQDLRKRLGTTFAFLGDEIYLRAGGAVPARSHYGDYPQIEDGIGMVRSFGNEFTGLMRRLGRQPIPKPGKVNGTILTGTLFAPVFRPLIEKMNARFGTRLKVEAVENNYFGGDVSVAGLLTGGDLLAARSHIQGDFVVIPKSTLKSDEEIMLDGMKLNELSVSLDLPVYPFDLKSFSQFLNGHGN